MKIENFLSKISGNLAKKKSDWVKGWNSDILTGMKSALKSKKFEK